MKIYSHILVIFGLFFMINQGEAHTHLSSLVATQGGNSQNVTDTSGLRQGYWKIMGAMSIEEGYKSGQVIEEGKYIDNKRQGLWKKYYPTGSLRSEITYSENHPYGYYTTYYADGKTEEEGYWKANKNTGAFTRFHENGKPAQEFTFNSKGKRDGVQNYYYPNGKLQLSVELDNGVAHGIYKSYYPDGSLKEEKRLTNGEVEPESVKKYEPKNAFKIADETPDLPKSETTPSHTDTPNLAEFRETGFNSLYNRNKQISQVGDFMDGRLWNGKWYKYDENGILRKVEVYKEGRFIGYGIIDESNN